MCKKERNFYHIPKFCDNSENIVLEPKNFVQKKKKSVVWNKLNIVDESIAGIIQRVKEEKPCGDHWLFFLDWP
jgi:hypothetical protein